MAPRNSRLRLREGFTLVELLVVIGIIIVLIGILLPVLGHVRKAAWGASSQASIMNLASAIERYRQEFNAYPGLFSNSSFDATTGLAPMQTSAGTTNITMSENLVLSLLGGFEPGASGTPAYNGAMVGNG